MLTESLYLKGDSYNGEQGRYTGGGYVVTLNGTTGMIRETFAKLRQQNWIDKSTRALFIEMSVYNAQINYFGVIEMVAESPPTGKYFHDVL